MQKEELKMGGGKMNEAGAVVVLRVNPLGQFPWKTIPNHHRI